VPGWYVGRLTLRNEMATARRHWNSGKANLKRDGNGTLTSGPWLTGLPLSMCISSVANRGKTRYARNKS